MKLRKYATLITAMARADAGKQVRVELGERTWWPVGNRNASSYGCFEPLHDDPDAWESDLFQTWGRDEWVKEEIPAVGKFTADFYVHVPAGWPGEWEMDTNVGVTFVNGKPVSAYCTGGREFLIDADAGTFRQIAAPRNYLN